MSYLISIGWRGAPLHGGGGGYIKMQILVLAHQPCMGSPGDLERETTIPLSVLCHSLPSPCTNFSNKSAMVRVVMKGHPDTDTPKPVSKVGCHL
jgi:hypothetical protein